MRIFPSCFALIFSLVCVSHLAAQNNYTVTGIVVDAESGTALPGVTIRVVGTKRGTYTDKHGKFRLPLSSSEQRVAFSSVGYKPYETTFSSSNNNSTIRLVPAPIVTGNVTVTADISADEIIRRAIRKKEENRSKISTFSAVLYSKFIIEIDGNMFGQLKDRDKQMIMETFSQVYDDLTKQKRAIHILQRRQTSNIPADENILAIGNFANLYDETIQIMNTVIPTPLASDAFSYYNFQLLRRIQYEDKYIYELSVEPSTTLFPALRGTIRIVEGTYNLIEADLKPSETTAIAYVRDLHLRQKFEAFPNDIWQPMLLTITGKANIQIIAGFADVDVDINVTSMYTDVRINEAIPDSVFNPERIVSVAVGADSSRPEFWENNSLSVQTEREKEIYQRIDSLVANTPPDEGSNADTNFRISLMPVLSYNRVSTVEFGGSVGAAYRPLSLSGRASYSTGLKKAFGETALSIELLRTTGATLSVSAGVFSRIAATPYNTPHPDILNTVFTALFHTDYNDYLLEDGWSAAISGGLSDLSYSLEGRFARQFCVSNTTAYSLFSSEEYRSNPVVQPGNYRLLRGVFEWGNYGSVISISNNLRADISARLIGLYGEESLSGLAFRSVEAGVNFQLPTFYTGYMPMSLDINISAGKGSDNLPRQYQFALSRRMPLFGVFGQFSSAPIGSYGGTEFLSVYGEHNFSDFFWRLLGLPEYEGRGLEFIVEGGAAVYRHTGAGKTDYIPTGDNAYAELGFGLGKIPTFISNVFFLRFDALWGIGSLGKGGFGVRLTLSSPF